MSDMTRRDLLTGAGGAVMAASAGAPSATKTLGAESDPSKRGHQRLSIEKLQQWESLGYGLFIHFGMCTFLPKEVATRSYGTGNDPATTYAPDRLDVDQWISVARDAGMKYAVLTAKHVTGHCLWPSKHTTYSVANSTNKTNVVEAFVAACERRDVLPGLYYCTEDAHHRFGGKIRSDPRGPEGVTAYTTAVYQGFMTAQITELLTQFGPLMEMWVDIPGMLGRGFRTYLYEYIARLQPSIVIMMNSGIARSDTYNVDYAWPSDLIAIERGSPAGSGYNKWRTIEGKEYYIPGEVCDPLGREWFWVAGDSPRADGELAKHYQACRRAGVNFLLNVPPDRQGVIPKESVDALMRLRKNAGV